MKNSAVTTALLAAALASSTIPASAQGLLGQILRNSRGPQPPSSQYPGATTASPGQARTDYLTELQIRGGQWVIVEQDSSGDFYPSVMACQARLGQDARLALSHYAVRPMAQRFLQPNVLVTKDGADHDDPVWKVAVLACGKGSPVMGQPADPLSQQIMAASGVDLAGVLAQATDLVRQTDGSFPPPPTQATMALAARDKGYIFTWVTWDAGGHLQSSKSGNVIFDTAAECDRFVSGQIHDALQRVPATKVIANSVLIPLDASEYDWFGCLHPQDASSATGVAYFDVKMSPERAKTMQRFPTFGQRPTDPVNPPSQRGKKVKI